MRRYAINNLSMISRLALLEEAEQTGRAIDALVQILRYRDGAMESTSSVGAELDIIEKMFHLYDLRKRSGFRGMIHKAFNDEVCYVPKGLLVSLVEIALEKDMAEDRGLYEIIVSVSKTETGVMVTLKDNGIMNETCQQAYDDYKKQYAQSGLLISVTHKPQIGSKVIIELDTQQGGGLW